MERPTDPHGPEGAAPPPQEKQHVFDDPRNVKRLIRVFFVACAVLLAIDLVHHRHGSFEESEAELAAEGIFGFYGLFGFVACVLLVLAAKYVLRKAVMRSEDYYDR